MKISSRSAIVPEPMDTASTDSRGIHAAVVAVACLVGAVLYQPWVSAPFDIFDFADFVPRLASASSPWDGFRRLFDDYLGHGRVNVVVYALTVLKWSLFGDWSPGWQLSRIVVLGLIAGQAYQLFRRFKAPRPAAFLGVAIILVAPTASPAWIRLSTGEPLGTLLVLLASNVCIRARTESAPSQWAPLQLALVTALVAFTKEMMLVCLVLPIGLYWLWPPKASAARDRRADLNFLMPTLVVGVLSVLVIGWGFLQTSTTGYATGYGARRPGLWELIPPWFFSYLPFDALAGEGGVVFELLAFAFPAVLAVGWWTIIRVRPLRVSTQAHLWLALAIVLPGLIALEYFPWPVYNRFYYLPASVMLGGLVALALTGFTVLHPVVRRCAFGVVAACLVVGALQGRQASDESLARRKVVGGAVRYAGSIKGVDTLLVGMQTMPRREWKGLAEHLSRYAAVVGVHLPTVTPALCPRRSLVASGLAKNLAFLSYTSMCPSQIGSTRVFVERYPRVHFAMGRVVEDSIRMDVIAPRRAWSFR